jgi:hypothetical protein
MSRASADTASSASADTMSRASADTASTAVKSDTKPRVSAKIGQDPMDEVSKSKRMADITNSIHIYYNMVCNISQSNNNFDLIKDHLILANDMLQQFPDLPYLDIGWISDRKYWDIILRFTLREYADNMLKKLSIFDKNTKHELRKLLELNHNDDLHQYISHAQCR